LGFARRFFKTGVSLAKKGDKAETAQTWTARPYQQDALDQFDAGKRRQVLIWHRRAGKDNFALNLASREAQREPGSYWHLFPTHVQARRAIWEGIDKTGIRFLDQAFPPEVRKGRLATRDMMIRFQSGSTWQMCGSDRYNSLVGSNPKGVVFSEFALADPRAWDYVRPIIRENGGWVVFITTYRGRGHAYRMANKLKNNPDWFVDIRTVDDTTDNDGNRILTDADVQAERDDGMSEAMVQQEYYCNPLAALPGAVYGRQMESLSTSNRLDAFTYDGARPVFASWSTLYDDQYTVAFWQTRNNAAYCIGSASFPFEALPDAIDQAENAFPWRYINRHILPHGTARELVETFEQRARITEIAPDLGNVFAVTRDQLATTHIDDARRPWNDDDQVNNERLVDALNGYRFTESQGGGSWTNKPVDSWEKHYAAAVETFAAYRHDHGVEVGGWHPKPSTAAYDAMVI
jgi:hypothetical protein